MSDYSWLGVIMSSLVSTLAAGSYMAMAVPYFDDAPYIQDLKKNTQLALLIGLCLLAFFFGVFYLSALYLDEDTSGPLLVFVAVLIALPVSMLLGTETWEHYHPKGMNRVPGATAVVIATGIGLAELASGALLFMLLFRVG